MIWLDWVDCDGNEESIAECSHNGWGAHGCEHSDDVSVSCGASPEQGIYTVSPKKKTAQNYSCEQNNNANNFTNNITAD